MSGFVGWWEVISAEKTVIEREIEQIRELCRDISRRIYRVEHWCGKRIATDNTKEMLDTIPGRLSGIEIRMAKMKQEIFDKHWERNSDK